MRVLVVGAGPGGLCTGFLLKRDLPEWEVHVVEQEPPRSTYGFGLVFSDRALANLATDDLGIYEKIHPAMETWTDLQIVHRGTRIVVDGVGFAAIGRLHLRELLEEKAAEVGCVVAHDRRLSTASELSSYDLVVGADGANSFVRGVAQDGSVTTTTTMRNRSAWYGTTRPFDTLTQTFVETPNGAMTIHHYRFTPGMSTFQVECNPDTWERSGFAGMDEPATRAYLERTLAETLDGHPLVANRSVWRAFPRIENERWWTPLATGGHAVLIGDALHTAHYSIGSGTRLALEDAIALARSLREHPHAIADALAAYEAARRPVAEKLAVAAHASAEWYEGYAEHMALAPWDFAWSYIQRSGRIDAARLRQLSPSFVAGYEASRSAR